MQGHPSHGAFRCSVRSEGCAHRAQVVPEGIQNAGRGGQSEAENPGEAQHRCNLQSLFQFADEPAPRTEASLRSAEISLTLSFNSGVTRGLRFAQLLSRYECVHLIGNVSTSRAKFPLAFEQKFRRSGNWIERRGKDNSLRSVNRVDT
jgi:hypothetical protein